MLLYGLITGTGVLLAVVCYVLWRVKRVYDEGKTLPVRVSFGFWVMDIIHFSLVALSAFYAVWPIPIDRNLALMCGIPVAGVGAIIMLAGMIEFRSLKRISEVESSGLVTTGVYRWSRNPQYVGWYLVLLGVPLMGASALAFLYSVAGIIVFHFYITRTEEPYLERIFGEEYLSYKSRTPRYIGIPRREKGRK